MAEIRPYLRAARKADNPRLFCWKAAKSGGYTGAAPRAGARQAEQNGEQTMDWTGYAINILVATGILGAGLWGSGRVGRCLELGQVRDSK